MIGSLGRRIGIDPGRISLNGPERSMYRGNIIIVVSRDKRIVVR